MQGVKAFLGQAVERIKAMPRRRQAILGVAAAVLIGLFIAAVVRGVAEEPAENPAQVELQQPPTGVLTEDEMDAALAEAGWPNTLWADVKFVAECESGWDTNAFNGTHVGLMQMDPNLHTWRSPTYELWSAYGNLSAALSLYDEVGWEAWDCAQ
jgi:hypothetical protein